MDAGSLGGMKGPPPILGDADSISAQLAVSNSESTLQYLYDFSLMILYGFVTLVSLLLWSRDRKVGLFLWLGIFTGTPAILLMLQEFLISISYGWGRGLNQPIYALNHISLWFLLLYLLRLDGNRRCSAGHGHWRSAHSRLEFLTEVSRFSGAALDPGCRARTLF